MMRKENNTMTATEVFAIYEVVGPIALASNSASTLNLDEATAVMIEALTHRPWFARLFHNYHVDMRI